MQISYSAMHNRQMGNAATRTRGNDSGVTLIEMLVVLTLIGVGAAVVTFALPSGVTLRTVEQEVTLLKARLNLVAERSLIEGRQYRMEWTSTGYGFETQDGGEWRKVADGSLAAIHVFEQGLMLTDGDGMRDGKLSITPDLLPSIDGVYHFEIEAGSISRGVTFDGAAAHIVATAL